MIAQLHLIAGHGVAFALVGGAALLAWALVRGSRELRVAGWLAVHHDPAAYVLALAVLVGLGGVAGIVAASMAFPGPAIRHPSLISG